MPLIPLDHRVLGMDALAIYGPKPKTLLVIRSFGLEIWRLTRLVRHSNQNSQCESLQAQSSTTPCLPSRTTSPTSSCCIEPPKPSITTTAQFFLLSIRQAFCV